MNSKISKLILCLYFIPQALCFGQLLTVKVGSSANNEDGDFPRDAWTKANFNFQYLLNNGVGGGISQSAFTAGLAAGTNAFVAGNSGFTFPGGNGVTKHGHVSSPAAWETMDFTLTTGSGGGVSQYVFDQQISAPSYVGDGSRLTGIVATSTNVSPGNTFSAGSNLTVTTSTNANGTTNYQGSVSDPLAINQLNVTTLNATNFITATNAFAGTLADFSRSDSTTNLGGNLTFTGVANLTAGAHNATIVHMVPNGGDRTIGVPGAWRIARGSNLVVSNAFNHSDFLITCQPGVNTNIAEIDYQ